MPTRSNTLVNLTGLPVYPDLDKAAMDPLTHSEALGRMCSRFIAETSYPLAKVELWYRKKLIGASETDLTNDVAYRRYGNRLVGIKLAVGIDYVSIFSVANQSRTSIELHRCSAPGER